MKFGEILTRIRTDKKLSQKEVAEITGLHRSEISLLESGARYPKRQSYNKIIRGLGISEKDLPYVEHTKKELRLEVERLKKVLGTIYTLESIEAIRVIIKDTLHGEVKC